MIDSAKRLKIAGGPLSAQEMSVGRFAKRCFRQITVQTHKYKNIIHSDPCRGTMEQIMGVQTTTIGGMEDGTKRAPQKDLDFLKSSKLQKTQDRIHIHK